MDRETYERQKAFAGEKVPSMQGDNFGGSEVTGIVSVSVGGGFPADPSTSAPWLTRDGRRLDGKPTRSGICIVGGKKVSVK